MYWRNTSYLQSCAPISVLLDVCGATDSHTPVFYPWHIRQAFIWESTLSATARYSLDFCAFQQLISARLYLSSLAWSSDHNSTRPRRATHRYLVTTHNAFQLPWAFRFGSSMARPESLTGNPVIDRPGMVVSTHRKSTGSNYSQGAFSTSLKLSPIPWVEHCTEYHYCWKDFCRPT